MLDTTGIVLKDLDPNCGISRSLDSAVKAWRAFCELPDEEKVKFSLAQFETDWADPGYFRKRKADGHDEKEYFHIFSLTRAFLGMTGKDERNYPSEAIAFLATAENLHRQISELLTESNQGLCVSDDFARRIKREISFSKYLFALRFLKYDTTTFGQEICRPHPDKNGVTVHLYSSHPGLQYLSNADPRDVGDLPLWYNLEVRSGQVALFNGSQMLDFSAKKVRPLIHRVIQTSSKGESRYSVVLFAPFFSVWRSPKEARIADAMVGLQYS